MVKKALSSFYFHIIEDVSLKISAIRIPFQRNLSVKKISLLEQTFEKKEECNLQDSETPFIKRLLRPWRLFSEASSTREHDLEPLNGHLYDLEFYHDPRIEVSKVYRTPKYPVVLCHGLFGFDNIGPLRYWQGVQEQLEEMGCEIFVASVPSCASIEERALSLQEQLMRRFPAGTNLNLIAHSMGGLDCRYLISRLGFPASHELCIRSLTTISTPHRGSLLADLVSSIHLEIILEKTLGLRAGGFYNLTTAYCKDVFNPSTPDKPGVLYYSFGASPQQHSLKQEKYRSSKSWLLAPFHQLILEREGPNDGCVSINSSKWGTYLGTLPSDHLDLRCLNNNGIFRAADLYCQLADHLHHQNC